MNKWSVNVYANTFRAASTLFLSLMMMFQSGCHVSQTEKRDLRTKDPASAVNGSGQVHSAGKCTQDASFAFHGGTFKPNTFLSEIAKYKGKINACILHPTEATLSQAAAYDATIIEAMNSWNALLDDYPYWPYRKLDIKTFHLKGSSILDCTEPMKGSPNAAFFSLRLYNSINDSPCPEGALACASWGGSSIATTPNKVTFLTLMKHEYGHNLGFLDTYPVNDLKTVYPTRTVMEGLRNDSRLTNDDKVGLWYMADSLRGGYHFSDCGKFGSLVVTNIGTKFCLPNGTPPDASYLRADLNPAVFLTPFGNDVMPSVGSSEFVVDAYRPYKWYVNAVPGAFDALIKRMTLTVAGVKKELIAPPEDVNAPLDREVTVLVGNEYRKPLTFLPGASDMSLEIEDTKGRITKKTWKVIVKVPSNVTSDIDAKSYLVVAPGATFSANLKLPDAPVLGIPQGWDYNLSFNSTSKTSCSFAFTSSDRKNGRITCKTSPENDNAIVRFGVKFYHCAYPTTECSVNSWSYMWESVALATSKPLKDVPVDITINDIPQEEPFLTVPVLLDNSFKVSPVDPKLAGSIGGFIFLLGTNATYNGEVFSPYLNFTGLSTNDRNRPYDTSTTRGFEYLKLSTRERRVLLFMGKNEPSAPELMLPIEFVWRSRVPSYALSRVAEYTVNKGDTLTIPINVGTFFSQKVSAVKVYNSNKLIRELKGEPHEFTTTFDKAGTYYYSLAPVDDLGLETRYYLSELGGHFANYFYVPEIQGQKNTFTVKVNDVPTPTPTISPQPSSSSPSLSPVPSSSTPPEDSGDDVVLDDIANEDDASVDETTPSKVSIVPNSSLQSDLIIDTNSDGDNSNTCR